MIVGGDVLRPVNPSINQPSLYLGRLCILHISVQPLCHFPQHMHDRFSTPVAVTFMGEHNQPDRSAVTLESVVESSALDRKGAGVVVCFAVDQQDRFVYLVGMHER